MKKSKVQPLRPNRRKKKLLKFMMLVCLLVIAAAAFAFSPIFTINTIHCTELAKYSKEEILGKINLNVGMNIFSFNISNAKETLENDPYISSVKFQRNLPGTLDITIKERRVRGYVPYLADSYLYIDEYGRVLDIQSYFKDPLPIVEGLEFDSLRIGELLPVKNQEAFDVVVMIAQMITKYDLLDIVVRIDVSDPKNVYAYVNNVTVMLGSIQDCDEKIRNMAEMVRQIPEGDRGTLDLRDMSKPIVFQYLT